MRALSTSTTRRSFIVLLAALAVASPTPVRGRVVTPTRASAALTLLSGHTPALQDVVVTTLTCPRAGLCYGAGRYIIPETSDLATRPYRMAGSVFLTTHDDGAHWDERISTMDPRVAEPGVRDATWRDHAALPPGLTALGIAVDPFDPRHIVVSGCGGGDAGCTTVIQGYPAVQTTDGGASWSDALAYRGPLSAAPEATSIKTTIRVTPALVRAIQTNGDPVEASGLLFDPHKKGHLWACAQGIGVVSSTNGGRAWSYAPQPRQTHAPCDLALIGRSLYRLDRLGALYASPDAGAHWALRSTPGALPVSASGQSFAGGLSVFGGGLSLVEDGGLYVSRDGGRHFVVVIDHPATTTDVVEAVRTHGRWVAAVGATVAGRTPFPNGLYTAGDRGRFVFAAATDLVGAHGALDMQAMYGNRADRLWADPATGTVFTSGPVGGLFRWAVGG